MLRAPVQLARQLPRGAARAHQHASAQVGGAAAAGPPPSGYPSAAALAQSAVAASMARGALVPDALVQSLLAARLSAPDAAARGYVLDGFPRSRSQAEGLLAATRGGGGAPQLLVELAVDAPTAAARVAGRGEGRADDACAEAVARRLAAYDAAREGVVGALAAGGVQVAVVDCGGGRGPAEVVEEVRAVVAAAGASRVVVAGRAGCGKSVVGRALAQRVAGAGGGVHVSTGELLRKMCAREQGLAALLDAA